MTRSCFSALVTLSLLSLVGCSERSKEAPRQEPAAAAVAAPADPDAELPANKKLALAKVSGSAGVDKVVSEAQKAARQNMAKDELWILLGRAWVRKARESNDPGFYLNADAAADVVLEKNPEQPLALNLRALVLMNGHKFEEARANAERVVAKHPDDPMAWGNLSDALLEMGRYEEAGDAVQKMVDIKPNLPSYSRVSYVRWLHGDVKGSKEVVRAALDAGRAAKSDPEPGAWTFVQAAMIFWAEGDFDGADAGFDKALERMPNFPAAQVGKGRVAMTRKEYSNASALFEQAYKASPLVETAWLLADAREAAGDKKGAEEARGMVAREGKRTDPRTYSLFLSTKNKEPELALKLAREEYEVRKDVYTEDALAWALYRAGKLDDAKASITKARRLGTPDARLMYHEGAIRIATGDVAKGRKLVADALKLNPAFDATAAHEAAELLNEKVAAR